MENIYDADLVVFDEINYKAWTNYEMELLFNIISRRISEGKSNIFTTNYLLNDIAERLGPRLASRVIGGSELVEFKGLDRRAYSKIMGEVK
jgi:DNA replication protein DnaC